MCTQSLIYSLPHSGALTHSLAHTLSRALVSVSRTQREFGNAIQEAFQDSRHLFSVETEACTFLLEREAASSKQNEMLFLPLFVKHTISISSSISIILTVS